MIRKQPQKNNFIGVFSVALVSMLVLSGCKKEQQPSAPPVQQAKALQAPASAVQKAVSSALRLPPHLNQSIRFQ